MNFREQVGWWVSGETSKIVVETYDDTFDAILFPLLSASLSWTLAYGAGNLVSIGGLLPIGSAALGVVLSLAFATLATVSAVASYEYATEPTQDVLLQEVSA